MAFSLCPFFLVTNFHVKQHHFICYFIYLMTSLLYFYFYKYLERLKQYISSSAATFRIARVTSALLNSLYLRRSDTNTLIHECDASIYLSIYLIYNSRVMQSGVAYPFKREREVWCVHVARACVERASCVSGSERE